MDDLKERLRAAAARIAALETQLEGAHLTIREQLDIRAALEADNARLMGTLQFYAREQSWRSMGMHMCGHSPDSTAVIDGGKRARATLAKTKEATDA